MGEPLGRPGQDAVIDRGEARRNDLGGDLTKWAEAWTRSNAGDKAICKRYENPAPAGGGIEDGEGNGPRGHDAGGGVIHLFWKAE